MFQDITVEEWLKLRKQKEWAVIDVRSPKEFADSAIPGSVNIPLFDDEERAEIGTLYKQTSVEAAKERGLEIVSAKLPAFVKAFTQIEANKIVYCWRGGMRSKTTATVLALMGIHVYRLSGGIREYRRWVVSELEQFDLQPQVIVLHGNTGSGKTTILHQLKDHGIPVLDLEMLAGHRGSIFGGIGMSANNQKSFDAQLLDQLHQFNESPILFIEAESKRLGKVTLPDFIIESKLNGIHVHIDMPKPVRVKRILQDYQPWKHKNECIQAFEYIKKRIHTPVARQIQTCLQQDEFDEAVSLLLTYYYDPRYEYAKQQYEGEYLTIQASDAEEATTALLDWMPKFSKKH